jgi:hypothetical protein
MQKSETFKKFTLQIENILSSFDSMNEWADIIEFLSKILKILLLYMPEIKDIPRKSLVAKRLMQCLNPALPSGVHQKTLEVYATIFLCN